MGVKNPNPQGKGQVPMLQAWQDLSAAAPQERSQEGFLLDYLAGSLVLAAGIRFKPVLGRDYYLYWLEDRWSLSMVSPQEWGQRDGRYPVALCRLRRDLSWELTGLEGYPLHEEAIEALRNFQLGFLDFIDNDQDLVDGLPFHSPQLSWHARLLGLGLSKTLQASLELTPALSPTGSKLLAALERPALLTDCLASDQ